jgi:hypothetical protein
MSSLPEPKVEEGTALPGLPNADPDKAVPPAKKRKHTETVAQVQDQPFEKWMEEHIPDEPLSANMTMGRTTAPVFPKLDGMMKIINEANSRIENALGYLQTPGKTPVRGEWLKPLKWACLRELLLATEYHQGRLCRPRPVNEHNPLKIPLDVSAAIGWLSPFKSAGVPTLYLDVNWTKKAVLEEEPGFDPEDPVMFSKYASLLPFFEKNKMKTFSTVSLTETTSLLPTGVLKDDGKSALVTEEAVTVFQMFTALKLDLNRCVDVDGVFIPVLQKGNRHLSPLISSYKSGDWIDIDRVWSERIHYAMSCA